MTDLIADDERSPQLDARLSELQRVIHSEIPICQHLGVAVRSCQDGQLVMTCPLDLNHNHQATAFAGSLNALCTITGWGMTYLTTMPLDPRAVIVIRRSTIKYHRPVDSPVIVARCQAVSPAELAYFSEMLSEKGQAKLDLTVEIDHGALEDRPRVDFKGSYVATLPETA